MTDREIVVNRLKRLIKAAHNDMSDFVFVTVGTANVIVRLLEEQERVRLFVDESGKITPLNVQEPAKDINVPDKIVRCKDCKHWSAEKINDFNKCRRWINVGVKNFATMGDWFCADGERRDTE